MVRQGKKDSDGVLGLFVRRHSSFYNIISEIPHLNIFSFSSIGNKKAEANASASPFI
jgi:hypothetical protein